MNIKLTKESNQRTLKAGVAYYLLLMFIPFIGSIITLVLIILKKQFRGIALNQFLVSLIMLALVSLASVLAIISAKLSAALVLIITLFSMAFGIFLFIHLILNSNKYSLAQYIKEGYEIENFDELNQETKIWIEENKDIKRPKFLLLDF